MRFIDEAEILVQAGHGGPGAVSFRREKFVPYGGPDGGEGGRGGHIYLIPEPNLGSLMDFRYKKKFFAENGHGGSGGQRAGKDGKDIYLKVPIGTIIRDKDTDEILVDITRPSQNPIILCKGGRGGKGNSHFKTSTHQTPRFAQPGEEGEIRQLRFELKLLADVAIIGLPNAGKSSLISEISAARPKIADYPFTTLIPNLGVVRLGEMESFVVADVPGLIAGAHKGTGLGIRFLKHIERCHILLHVIDVSMGRDPKQDYEVIRTELGQFDPKLLDRPEIILFNKMDALQDSEALDAFCVELDAQARIYRKISVATHLGIQDVLWLVFQKLQELKKTNASAGNCHNNTLLL